MIKNPARDYLPAFLHGLLHLMSGRHYYVEFIWMAMISFPGNLNQVGGRSFKYFKVEIDL